MIYETLVTKADWASLEGEILPGGYELKNALELKDTEATFKVRILGSGGVEATATFYQGEPAALNEQVAIWDALRHLVHPNLSMPLAAGRKRVNGVETAFVLLAMPDEQLSEILTDRPLSWEEGGELLRSLERSLAYLHANGFVHGCVSPETIVSQGYSIQLATWCVRRSNSKPAIAVAKPRYLAPESVMENVTAASDVWCLGATLFEVLSQEAYDAEAAELTASLPLAAVIKRCLEKDPRTRCTLREAPAILDNPAAPPVKRSAAGVAEKAPETAKTGATPTPAGTLNGNNGQAAARNGARVADSPAAASTPGTARSQLVRALAAEDMALVPLGKRHRPVRGKRQPIPAKIRAMERSSYGATQPEDEIEEAEQPRFAFKTPSAGFRGALVGTAGLVAAAAALVWFVVIPRLQAPLDQAGPAAPPAVTESARGSAWPTKTLPSAENATAAIRDGDSSDAGLASARQTAADRATPGRNWRVILYSYAHEQDAQRRVQLLTQNHPEIQAHVLAAMNGGPFMVVMGGAMDHEQALETKRKAVELGMPHSVRVESF